MAWIMAVDTVSGEEGAGDTATRFMCRRAVHRHHFALRHRAHVVLRWEEEAVQ